MNSDVLLLDNSIQQETILIPVTAVQPDLVTQTDQVIYVPLASKTAHGIVKIGEGFHITADGLLSFDRSEVTIKEILLNDNVIEPDDNKRVNIILSKNDVGLNNVDNTSDEDKPVSLKTQNALDSLETKLSNNIRTVDNILTNHINDFNNPHRVTKTQVGLGNVDNTADDDKPISRATQRELTRIQGLIKGSEGAVSYDSYEELINDLNTLSSDVYNVGQSVFIKTLKVPDLWVYSVDTDSVEFVYNNDAEIENILKETGLLKVGYYTLAALDTLKVDLSNYINTDDILRELDIYVEHPQESNYVYNAYAINELMLVFGQEIATVNENLDTLETNSATKTELQEAVVSAGTYIDTQLAKKVSKEEVLNALDTVGELITDLDDTKADKEGVLDELKKYLTTTAGSAKKLTGDLYFDNTSTDKSLYYIAGAQIRGTTAGDLSISSKNGRNIFLRCDGTSEADTGIRFNRPSGITVADFYPQTTGRVNLGTSTNKFNNIHGTTIYQNGKQVANADDLSAVTDATLSDDNKTLTVTKRDGSSFEFQGGGDVDLSGYIRQGGTLTAPLTVTGGDQATAGKIILDQNNKGQITNTGTQTLFGFNSSGQLDVGHSSYKLSLRGSATRPIYNNKDVALLNDTYQSKQTIAMSGAVTQTIQPNVKYEFTGDLTSLTLTMAAPVSGRRNIYSVSFKTGASMNSIKITPASGFLKYGLCTPRSLDVNTNYLIEIEDDLAIISPVYSTFVVSTKTSIEGTTTSGLNGGSLIVIYNDTGKQIDTLVDAGAEVLINANPSTNYSLYRLIVNDTIVSNNHVQNITDDTEISAIFLGNTTTITWSVPTGVSSVTVTKNGTAISSGATVRFGDVISVSATAATGYTVTKSSTGLSGKASGYVNAANPTITFTATASS